MKTTPKNFFFAIVAISFLFLISCKKEASRDFATALLHPCPYLSDSSYVPTDITVDTTKGWKKFYDVWIFINPNDSSDIIVYSATFKGSYFFSLTAAKREAEKTGKKLPTKELIERVQKGLSNFEYAMNNPTFGFFVSARIFFRGEWKDCSGFYGSETSTPQLTAWGGNDPKGEESLIAQYGHSNCSYSIGLTEDQKRLVRNQIIHVICLQIRWAK